MSSDIGRILLEDFLSSSRPCIEAMVRELELFRGDENKKVHLFFMKNGRMVEHVTDCGHFLLRTSVEYSNPQLTLEEVQGIIAARMLEVCGDYFHNCGLKNIGSRDIDEIRERLSKPSAGTVTPFLLNTDDVEPDRYSVNPLKESIVSSGQSAFASASVKTEDLRIDEKFMKKYEGKLVSKFEADLVTHYLADCGNSYVDMVDAVKYDHLMMLSELFAIDLSLPMMRMPLAVLANESTDGFLHHVIREAHKDYEAVERVYDCMGRSMKNRTTLLTIPHSKMGFASKKAAKGKIYFEAKNLKSIRIEYKKSPLYPNAIDPEDVSVAEADDQFEVDGRKFAYYDYRETPSSPQFILYSLASLEDACLWHGIGEFGASQLVKSYTTIHLACAKGAMFNNLGGYGIKKRVPLQFNLVPENLWFHPLHRNIDASIGCIENLEDLTKIGMKLEYLSTNEYAR